MNEILFDIEVIFAFLAFCFFYVGFSFLVYFAISKLVDNDQGKKLKEMENKK